MIVLLILVLDLSYECNFEGDMKIKIGGFELLVDTFSLTSILQGRANGLRYPRWGGDGEAVRLEKC